MFEESMSIPAIWASMNSWFTSTVLFFLLNVMIATIFFTSRLGTHKQQQQQNQSKEDPQQQQQTEIARSPSVLQRLKSINFYHYTSRSQEHTTTTTTFIPTPQPHTNHEQEQTHEEEQPHVEGQPHVEEERTHEEEQAPQPREGEKTIDEVYSQLHGRHVSRSASDTRPASGEVPVKLPKKMKKSASEKSAFAHFVAPEEDGNAVESRRPATVREGKARMTEAEGGGGDAGEEVDARADDFINKFRQQLKLQRLDSIIRNKEMLTRGNGK